MGNVKKFLENLVDTENFNKSAGDAIKIVALAFVGNVASNLILHINPEELGVMKHLLAGAVAGGVLDRATSHLKAPWRYLVSGAVVSAANFGWEALENKGHLYGTVADSSINYWSDIFSVYAGAELAIIKERLSAWYKRE